MIRELIKSFTTGKYSQNLTLRQERCCHLANTKENLMQHFFLYSPRFLLSGNGKASFNPILDPDADPDHHQNLIASKFGQV